MPPARIAGAARGRARARSSGSSPPRPSAERLREGALLVLAGRPNAGKSSLFNALLGTERALVTEIPGTTRDAIEAHTDFLGWPVRLADTAGLWDATERIDRLGVEVSRRYLAAADLVLLCVGGGPARRAPTSRPSWPSGRRSGPHQGAISTPSTAGEGVAVSAVTGEGLDALAARRGRAGLRRADRARRPGAGAHPRAPPHGAGSARAGGAGRARSRQLAAGGDAVLARTMCGRRRRARRAGRGGRYRGGAGSGVRELLRGEVDRCDGAGLRRLDPLAPTSSAAWNSAAGARSASASPRSATSASVIR